MVIKRIFLFVFCLLTVKGVSIFVDRGKIMTPEITVPYFSGAAIHSSSDKWIFNLNEVDTLKKFNEILDPVVRRNRIDNYKFSTVADSTHGYQINQPGLVYVILIAKKIFFFQGDIGALKSFQLLVHTIFCFLILINLRSRTKELIFMALYFFNPAIIYLTIFPFYYFWQVIGSFIVVSILLNPKYQTTLILFLSAFLLAGICHIRISTLPLSILIILFGFYRVPLLRRSIAFLLFVFSAYLMEPTYLSKHPGHVMYSSLGAYPDSPVQGFSDNISFMNYSKSKGVHYSYESTPSMYDPEVIMGEAKWGMQEFKSFLKQHPFIVIRNAILNFLESFSIGYSTSSMALTLLSAFTGLCFLFILIVRKKYSMILLIIASTITFILYLAPVPIYLYGTYILLVYAFLDLFPSTTFYIDQAKRKSGLFN